MVKLWNWIKSFWDKQKIKDFDCSDYNLVSDFEIYGNTIYLRVQDKKVKIEVKELIDYITSLPGYTNHEHLVSDVASLVEILDKKLNKETFTELVKRVQDLELELKASTAINNCEDECNALRERNKSFKDLIREIVAPEINLHYKVDEENIYITVTILSSHGYHMNSITIEGKYYSGNKWYLLNTLPYRDGVQNYSFKISRNIYVEKYHFEFTLLDYNNEFLNVRKELELTFEKEKINYDQSTDHPRE